MSSKKNIKKPKEQKLVGEGLWGSFLLVSSLFFIWGFARSILDVLNRHFQDTLHVSLTASTFVQFSTYLAYALMALPAGLLITRFGYRRGVVTGLLVFAAGAFLFLPGSWFESFAIYLLALFVIGCGLAVLEISANPYVAESGPGETAASRLNFAQSLNGLGCISGPVVMGFALFSNSRGDVSMPYLILGGVVMLLAIVFSRVKLPEIGTSGEKEPKIKEPQKDEFWKSARELIHQRWFLMSVYALFFYEIAEIGINSMFLNYVREQNWMDSIEATFALSFGGLLLFMFSRVVSALIMTRVEPIKMLKICGFGAVVCCAGVVADAGAISHYLLFGCYLFEAMMFPTIFALTVSRAGSRAKTASAIMMTTPLGGALGTLLMGMIGATWGMSVSFLIPCIGYFFVLIYSYRGEECAFQGN